MQWHICPAHWRFILYLSMNMNLSHLNLILTLCTHVLTTCWCPFWHQLNSIMECLSRLTQRRSCEIICPRYTLKILQAYHVVLHWTSEQEEELYRHCGQHDNHYGMQLQYTIIFLCVAMNEWTPAHLCFVHVHILWPILQDEEFHLVTMKKLTAISLARVENVLFY